jgi:hypothetical protein
VAALHRPARAGHPWPAAEGRVRGFGGGRPEVGGRPVPQDASLRRLITYLRAASGRFADLWDARAVGTHEEDRKTIHHPDVGPLTLDCDVLTAYGSDLRVVMYTAAPGSDDADRLKLLAVIGTQDMTEHPGGMAHS